MDYTLHDLPSGERPRERLRKVGVENLSLQELLALVIEKGKVGQNVLTVSQNLLSRFGNLSGIREASLRELQEVKGIGFATACKLKAAFRIGEKAGREPERWGGEIGSAEDVFEFLKDRIGDKKREHFVLLCLNSRNRLIDYVEISVGTLNASLAHPREIFRPAIKNSAASIILAHNHPSGDPQPGENDIKITKTLKKTSKIVGIPINDHVVVAGNDFVSLENGKL